MPGKRYTTPERISISADVQYMSPHSVSKKHHCPIPTIYKFKHRYAKGSPMKTDNFKGCPKKVSMAFKTKIERVVHANRRSPLKELKDKSDTFPLPCLLTHFASNSPWSRWRGWGATSGIIEDNAVVHKAKICCPEWNKQGLNMVFHLTPNFIEHAWAELKRHLAMVSPPPRTLDELWEAAQHVWLEIPKAYFKKLVLSMYQRRRAVEKACGGATRW